MAKTVTEVPEQEKRYSVRIPIDRSNPDDKQVYVRINEKTYMIQRGVDVEVPLEVVEQLKWMERATEMAIQYAEAWGEGKHSNDRP